MKKTIVIEGMMCPHCQKRVEDALNAVEGAICTVDLEKKTAFVELSAPVEDSALTGAVTAAGYTVVSIS